MEEVSSISLLYFTYSYHLYPKFRFDGIYIELHALFITYCANLRVRYSFKVSCPKSRIRSGTTVVNYGARHKFLKSPPDISPFGHTDNVNTHISKSENLERINCIPCQLHRNSAPALPENYIPVLSSQNPIRVSGVINALHQCFLL